MLYDAPRFGNGIHWRALAMLLLPVALAGGARLLAGPIHVGWLALIYLAAAPISAIASWKYSCYVADTHAQPWGFISFFAMLGCFVLACTGLAMGTFK